MSLFARAAIAVVGGGGVVALTSRPAGSQGVSDNSDLQAMHVKLEAEKRRIRDEAASEKKRLQGEVDRARAEMKREGATGKGEGWKNAAANERRALDEMSRVDGRTDKQLSDATALQSGAVGAARERTTADATRAVAEAEKSKRTSAELASSKYWAAGGAAVGVAAAIAAAVISRRVGAGAVKAINTLGASVAKTVAQPASKPILGTPAGDRVRAAVTSAERIGGKAPYASLGQVPRAADVVSYGIMAEGALTTGASFVVKDPETAATLRSVGVASLGFAGGAKAALAVSRMATSPVKARAVLALDTGAKRLAREAAGGTAAQTAAKAVVGNAQAAGQVVTAQAKISGKRARARAAAATNAGTVAAAKAQAAGQVVTAQAKTSGKRARARAAAATNAGTVAVAKAQATGRASTAASSAARAAFAGRVKTKQARLNAAATLTPTPAQTVAKVAKAAKAAPAPAKPVMITAPRATVAAKRPPRQRAPYKDTWTDKLGRTYTRKDASIRRH